MVSFLQGLGSLTASGCADFRLRTFGHTSSPGSAPSHWNGRTGSGRHFGTLEAFRTNDKTIWRRCDPRGFAARDCLGVQWPTGWMVAAASGSLSPVPEPRTTKKLVETVDDFVAAQSLLVQQRSTSLNTQPVSH